jgi:hypothetical protein
MLNFFVTSKLIPVIIAIVLMFFGAFIAVSRKPKPTQPSTPTVSTGSVYQSDYLSFTYPTNFTLEKVITTDARVVENWKLTQKDNPAPTTITLMLFTSTKDLATFEPLASQRRDPGQYLEEVSRMNNLRGILFRTIDKKERIVYFSNKKEILLVDYIAKTTDPGHEIEFQTFLDQINWK